MQLPLVSLITKRLLPAREGPMYEENLADINLAANTTDCIRLLRPSRSPRDKGGLLWRLKVFSLRTAPQFAALSYSWGDRSADKTLRLDTGSTVVKCSVSSDLLCALRRLRQTNDLRWPWMDALCIDQGSTKEKNHQVMIMKSIYSAATRVYVWLGEAVPRLTPHQDFANTWPTRELALNAGIHRVKVGEWILQGTQVWWQRSWIMQEVVSCKNVFICIGHHCTPWDSFWDLLSEYTDQDAQTIGTIGIAYRKVVEANQKIRRMMKLRRDLQSKPNGENISNLLWRTSPAGVSYPPDRIYSLLGLATAKDRRNIPINYGQPLADIFAGVVMYLISIQRKLNFLFAGWPRGEGSQSVEFEVSPNARRSVYRSATVRTRSGRATMGLPTWVPNFMKPRRTLMAPWHKRGKYCASLKRQPIVEARDGCLRMVGLLCDVVANVVARNMFGADGEGFWDVAEQFLTAEPDMKHFSGSHNVRQSLTSTKHLTGIMDVMDPAKYPSTDWYCFSTYSGFIGLSLEKVEEGDLVVVAFGSPAPVIIRWRMREHEIDTAPSEYALVGDCFVDGIMNGELMQLYEEGIIGADLYHLT